MGINIATGSSTAGLANVDSNYNLFVNLPGVLLQAGFCLPGTQTHDSGGMSPATRRALRGSPDARLRIGQDTILWHDFFNTAQQDLGRYQITTSTMTTQEASGAFQMNNGASVATSAVARLQTYRTFQLVDSSALLLDFRIKFNVALVANYTAEWGLGFASAITAPTDGILFRTNSAGALLGVVNINGSEQTVNLITTPTAGNFYHFQILLDQDRVEFYVNGAMEGWIGINAQTATNVASVALTTASLPFSTALPILVRTYNASGASPSSAVQLWLAEIAVTALDVTFGKPWSVIRALGGDSAVQVARGTAAAQSANYANSAGPASATLSNTAAGYTTLGGQWQFVAVAGAETDYALFAFQVPAAAANAGNRNLVITGVHIGAFNTGAAVATTPTLLQWAIGVGSTAVSLATTDSATAGTRAPRKIAIGSQSFPIGAVIGANVNDLDVQFNSPLVAEAGTFVHVILKMPVGTATASQVVRGTCSINGYWE